MFLLGRDGRGPLRLPLQLPHPLLGAGARLLLARQQSPHLHQLAASTLALHGLTLRGPRLHLLQQHLVLRFQPDQLHLQVGVRPRSFRRLSQQELPLLEQHPVVGLRPRRVRRRLAHRRRGPRERRRGPAGARGGLLQLRNDVPQTQDLVEVLLFCLPHLGQLQLQLLVPLHELHGHGLQRRDIARALRRLHGAHPWLLPGAGA
mmetsp:Transcript_56277/g.151755  ORF Transcript_56277/g.151755 Transcript_56277/m.151755 type:complete len:204 (-) Transcript_56277:7-618(-)